MRQRNGHHPEKALNRSGLVPWIGWPVKHLVSHQRESVQQRRFEPSASNNYKSPNKKMNKKGREKIQLKPGMHRGFQKGYDQVPVGKIPELKTRLMRIVGGMTRAKMLYWRTGMTVIQPEDGGKIEAVFSSFGITDIWDE